MSDRRNGVPTTVTSIPLVDPHAAKADPSIGDLVKDATSQVSTLVRAEVELAKAEITRDSEATLDKIRFWVAECTEKLKPVRLRVFNVCKTWVSTHWNDFAEDESLVTSFLETVEKLPEMQLTSVHTGTPAGTPMWMSPDAAFAFTAPRWICPT